MAVPKRKKSKSARDMRRAQHKVDPVSACLCPKCGEAKLPHRICLSCGHYNGKEVMTIKTAASQAQ